MQNFVHGMLHGSPAALKIESLWKVWAGIASNLGTYAESIQEYEAQETKEARFVKGPSFSCSV